MRKGWEYKKLGEVCEVVTGTTPKTNIPEYWGKGHYWVTPAELNDTTVYIDKTERQITDEALSKTKLRLLPVGTVLLSSRAPIGKVAIANAEMYCNQGFKNCICSEAIYNKYLFYFLRLKKDYLNSLGRGATFKEISKSIVESIKIPLPPQSTQLAIVSELDKINELIRLKKEQLKDFDNLAQSLFYEMFGDPVENEKGWEVKKLGDCFSYIKNGANIKQTKDVDGFPITRIETLAGGIFNRDRMGYAGIYDLSKYSAYVLESRDLLMSHINSKTYIGRTVEYKRNNDETIIHGMNLLRLKAIHDIIDSTFFVYYTKSGDFKSKIARIRKDAVNQSSFAISDLKRLNIPLPPLSLQRLFAQRIEQIEREKSEVQKSIQDLETLLASRMQYWFE